jgi:chaperonin cofactor prefoldin
MITLAYELDSKHQTWAQLQELKDRLNALNETMQSFTNEMDLSETNDTLSSIESDIESLNSDISSIESQGTTTHSKLEDIKTKLDSVISSIGTINTNLGTLESDVESTNTKLDSLDTKLITIDSVLDSILAAIPDEQQPFNAYTYWETDAVTNADYWEITTDKTIEIFLLMFRMNGATGTDIYLDTGASYLYSRIVSPGSTQNPGFSVYKADIPLSGVDKIDFPVTLSPGEKLVLHCDINRVAMNTGCFIYYKCQGDEAEITITAA